MDNDLILIIEDDKYISRFIDISLKKENYRVEIASTADEGMFIFTSMHPDIILLDLGLPDRDGLEVLHDIRSTSDTPIIVVSARGQEYEKVTALDNGANDYLTKPFYMGELLARIRVIERAAQKIDQNGKEEKFSCEWLTVDYNMRRVLVDGNEIHLTPIEYKTLLLLISNRGKVLTHSYIIQQIWGVGGADSKSVRVFMANLRRKIEKDTEHPRFILTEIGVGYRFSAE
jgi:two-component system KDP operon response regulator KdpE